MIDIEIVAACADAMGMDFIVTPNHVMTRPNGSILCYSRYYWPLKIDSEAVSLVKMFGISQRFDENGWRATTAQSSDVEIFDLDWNRAICRCVANMHTKKKSPNAQIERLAGSELDEETKP